MSGYNLGFDWHVAQLADRVSFAPSTVKFVELWTYASGEVKFVEGLLQDDEIELWLHRQPPRTQGGEQPTGGLRYLLAACFRGCDNAGWKFNFPFRKDTLRVLCDELGSLGHFFQRAHFGRGGFAVHTSRPDRYDISILPLPAAEYCLDSILSLNTATNVSIGILRYDVEVIGTDFVRHLKSYSALADSPLIAPAALVSLQLQYLLGNLTSTYTLLADIEDRTGHKGGIEDPDWLANNDEEKHVTGTSSDYRVLTIALSQADRNICDLSIHLKSICKLNAFVVATLNDLAKMLCKDERRLNTSYKVLKEDAEFRTTYLDHLNDELEFNMLRCRTQTKIVRDNYFLFLLDKSYSLSLISLEKQLMAFVFSLISQADNMRNIELAKDSRSLAVASKRDSSAMKTVAVLTTVFLPGTFISTFISMPLLSWDAASWTEVPTTHFWVYWAITIPLTLLTLYAWYVWQRYRDALSEEEDRQARGSIMWGKVAVDKSRGERKENKGKSGGGSESGADMMLRRLLDSMDLQVWKSIKWLWGRRNGRALLDEEQSTRLEDVDAIRPVPQRLDSEDVEKITVLVKDGKE